MILVFTCLIKGDDAAITKRIKAMKADILSQRREEDDDAILTRIKKCTKNKKDKIRTR